MKRVWWLMLLAVPLATAQSFVVQGDFNGDGIADRIGTLGCGAERDFIQVGLGKQDGTFADGGIYSWPTETPGLPYRGCGGSYLVAADFNRDGKLDLAIIHANGTGIVLLGNGDGTFAPNTLPFSWGWRGSVSFTVGDFNGDGKLDIAIVGSGGLFDSFGDEVTIMLGNGEGTFQGGRRVWPRLDDTSQITDAFVLIAGDFNGDGKLDIKMKRPDGTTITLLGNGDGTFTSQ